MNLSGTRSFLGLPRLHVNAGMVLGGITVVALVSFEMFNYSTTDFALRDLLGGLKFAGIPWSTILAIAFCGIDFAGIARLFCNDGSTVEPKETWYLFGAWFLAATMNAMLTWWGVSMAVVSHDVKSTAVMDANLLVKVVPIFVALMVWVIRILIIGTISTAGSRMFTTRPRRSTSTMETARRPGTLHTPVPASASPRPVSSPLTPRPVVARPNISASPASSANGSPRPEPTYSRVQ